jgi:hypothetical protein
MLRTELETRLDTLKVPRDVERAMEPKLSTYKSTAMGALAENRGKTPHEGNDAALMLVCLSCGDTMQRARTIPRLGSLRPLGVFVCPSCHQVLTLGIDERAEQIPD